MLNVDFEEASKFRLIGTIQKQGPPILGPQGFATNHNKVSPRNKVSFYHNASRSRPPHPWGKEDQTYAGRHVMMRTQFVPSPESRDS